MFLAKWGCFIALPFTIFTTFSSTALAANGANFVLYNHHTAETGEREIMLMADFGQEPDGTRYISNMIEFELGVTDRWTTEFMIEGQKTTGQGEYQFTGFRWENRYRLFKYGTLLNPVVYIEYEDLGEDTKYLMEVSGREDAPDIKKERPRERVLESRIILGQDLSDSLDVSFNWLNESDLDTGITAFGYALGINYRIRFFSFESANHAGEENASHAGATLGLELFGALGDSDLGATADSAITQHYISPNISFHLAEKTMLKFGGAIGLTNVSQDIFRIAVGYEF